MAAGFLGGVLQVRNHTTGLTLHHEALIVSAPERQEKFRGSRSPLLFVYPTYFLFRQVKSRFVPAKT